MQTWPLVMPPSFPEDALAALRVAQAQTLARGQIWWLPHQHVAYRGMPKGRYCLLIAIEETPLGSVAQGYFVAGTSKRASGPAVVLEEGESSLGKRTEFDFSLAWPVAATDVAAHARFVDDIDSRIAEIDRAIGDTRASELMAVKKVLAL